MAGRRTPGHRRISALAILVAASVTSALVAASCTRSRVATIARPGVTARLEKALAPVLTGTETARRVAEASGAGPVCFNDRVQFADVRKDVEALERAATAAPVTGRWKHLDLSRLPAAQAQYFLKGASHFSQSASYGGVSGLVDALNRAYGNKGDNEGYAHYAWWLRVGNFLSLDDTVPFHDVDDPAWVKDLARQKKKPGAYSFASGNEHFTEAELLGFWRLSLSMPAALRFMPTAGAIYRFPWGTYPEDWKRKDSAEETIGTLDGNSRTVFRAGPISTCADASTQGHIRYSPHCMLTDDGKKIGQRFDYLVLHEMAHLKDQAMLPAKSIEYYWSAHDPWLSLSGWSDITVTPGNPKSSSHEWVYDDKKGQPFVSDYAMTSPFEDFAESLAWSRVKGVVYREISSGKYRKVAAGPDELKELAPKKFNAIKRLVFGGRSYDREGLLEFYAEQAAASLQGALPQAVERCVIDLKDPERAVESLRWPARLNLKAAAVPPSVRDCLELEFDKASTEALNRLRFDEPEACDTFAKYEGPLRAEAYKAVSAAVDSAVTEGARAADLLREFKRLREDLGSQIDPREVYVHCHRSADPQDCYRKNLSEAVERVLASYRGGALKEVDLKAEADRFLAQAAYAETVRSTREFYAKALGGAVAAVVEAARVRWEGCLEATGSADPNAPVVTKPFSGGTQYVDAGILACVNGQALSDVTGERDRFGQAAGVAISDPDVQALVDAYLMEAYLTGLNRPLARDAEADREARAVRQSQVVAILGAEIASRKEWQSGLKSLEEAEARCVRAGEEVFEAHLGGLGEQDRISTRFISRADLKSSWVEMACSDVLKAPALSSALQEATYADGLRSLEPTLRQAADGLLKDCRNRNVSFSKRPEDLERVRTARKDCIRAGWTARRNGVLDAWERQHATPFFAERRSETRRTFDAWAGRELDRLLEQAGKDER